MTKNTWGSHIPINKAILKTFDITGVLELGIGLHSTSMFFENASNVISVETDPEWIKKIRQEIKETDTRRIIQQPTPPGVERATRRWTLTEEQLLEARNYFINLKEENPHLNFLFIDCISSFRYEALVGVAHKFDVVTLHDYELKKGHGRELHWDNGSYICPETHKMFLDKTYGVETAILIRNELCDKLDSLRIEHEKKVQQHFAGNASIVEFNSGNM